MKNNYDGRNEMELEVGKCLLKYQLDKIGMSQQELANLLKMPRSQISDYVHKRKIMSLKTGKLISIIVDCDISDLYEWIIVKDIQKEV
jgi:predicted XRE-type DNA-binding protein